MRLKKYIKNMGILSLFAATVMLSGCNMVLMNPKGAIGVEQNADTDCYRFDVDRRYSGYFMAFAFAWKFRASNKSATYTPNWSHSNKLSLLFGLFQSLSSLFWLR